MYIQCPPILTSNIEIHLASLQNTSMQRYCSLHKYNSMAYIYTPADLESLASHKSKKVFRNTHESFEKLLLMIQDYEFFQNSAQYKQREPAVHFAMALSRLPSNGNGAALDKMGMLFGGSNGEIALYKQHFVNCLINYEKNYITWPNFKKEKESSEVIQSEGFPGCVGFIDGSLIPVSQRPPKDGEAYFDRKKGKFSSSWWFFIS
ncbi:hypothetical protein O181_091254 [Austropuccinia psidii MF-1]|uniref:DDE Tnp4 domain-containing protein n=1 Tax=Austropuccinia psidii MF-1 TaxID=1389203 RepID=A0A9Q3P7Q6_9BASI|nr:hypothetical protein [Austropuccinia psidii MF-1]